MNQRINALVIGLAVFAAAAVQAAPTRPDMRVAIPVYGQEDVLRLRQLRIYLVGMQPDGDLLAEVGSDQLAALIAAGFRPEVVVADLEAERQEILRIGDGARSQYHSYSELTTDLQALATNYPNLCSLSSMGQSVQGRELWVLKISDNVSQNENEPQLRWDGNIHGDEKIGQEVAYLLAEELITSYGLDPEITALLDDREIWILPCANPDGMMAAQRYNANYVDCNRDYGYQWNGDGYSPSPLSQPETQAMAEYMMARPYSISMTYHSGIEMLLWSWCYTNDRPPAMLEHQYQQQQYSSISGYSGGQCGHVLYQVNGGSMDYDYGVNGALGHCVEISYTKTPPASQIDSYYAMNRDASLWLIEEAGYGIQGVVTDANTGEPLPAIVRVEGMYQGLRQIGYADAELGDFHIYLRPGTYDLQVWANDHELVSVPGVTVLSQQTTTVDVPLAPAADGYVQRVVVCTDTSYGDTNDTLTYEALGPPDDEYYSLGVNAHVILDMGEGTEIWDGDGDDFTVVEASGGDEGFQAQVSQDWRGPWQTVGSGSGTTSFDLDGTGLDEARYVKLIDDGDGSSSAPDPGFDLDAVVTTHIVPGCGFLTLSGSVFGCESGIDIQLIDIDLDLDPGSADEAWVHVSSDTDPAGMDVMLEETGANTGVFDGQAVLSATGAPGALPVTHGDLVTVLYQDADCQGASEVVQVAVGVDCEAPVISSVVVDQVTHDSARIRWSTDEPADSVVRYGDQVPPGQSASADAPVLEHSILLTGLEECTVYAFEVESTDAAGNTAVDDNGMAYYHFTTRERVEIFWEPMDTDPGWSISGGQWAWGQPTGGGGSYGNPDPTSGYSGQNVYGYNLNGDYANYMPEYHLTTPPFDCSEGTGVNLEFYGWLGVERNTYDHAYVRISTNGGTSWTNVWENSGTSMDGGSWEEWSFDLSSWADGQADVRIRWTMGTTDSGWTYCGWNIDDVLVSYSVECEPPTPTPTPTFTVTPTTTPSQTPTPAATETPVNDELWYDLVMPIIDLGPGDLFILRRLCGNPSQDPCPVDEYILLDVFGEFWFWPGWTQDTDWVAWSLAVGAEDDDLILSFVWPSGAGAAEGIRFWGAFLDQGTLDLLCYDMVEWGYH